MSAPVLLAGASRGIGKATAERLMGEGLPVVVSSRSAEALDAAYPTPSPLLRAAIPFDFSHPAEVEHFAERVTEQVGPIGGMVYCAGAQKTAPLSQCKVPDVQALFEVNTFSAFELVRCFSKKNRIATTGASFVLISSLAAHEGAMGKSLYGATKGALEGFLPAAAAELAPRGIRLNAIVPGVIKTDMAMEFINKMSSDQLSILESGYPLGLGTPQDAAELILFLLSDKSRWITGQCFVLDGGRSVRGS